MMDQDLIDLLSAWRGAELDAGRCEQLLERLRRDEAFRQEAVAEIRMLGMLKAVQESEPRWLSLREQLGQTSESRTSDEDVERAFLERIRQNPPRRVPRVWRWAAAAAVLGLGLGLAGYVGTREHRNPPIAPLPLPAAHADAATSTDLAMILTVEGVQWEPDAGGPLAEGDVLSARRLQLRAGRLSLAFFSGVTLTVEGPADVQLVNGNRVFCRRGGLRARVPKGAEGFVVATPGTAVIDRGTEFGLNVAADGKAQVMVFEGLAEAALLDASGTAKRTQLVEESKSFELDPGADRIAEAIARPDVFVPTPISNDPPLVLDPAYPSAVLASKPTDYWRFESLDAGAVPNELPKGRPLRVTGPIDLSRPFGGNRCAVFKSDEPEESLDTTGWWDLARTPGHAVELWFQVDAFRSSSLVGFYPPPELVTRHIYYKFAHCFLLETVALERQSLHKAACVRFAHRLGENVRVGDNVYSERRYVPRRWHHVVAQKNGDRMELYFDGVAGAPLELSPDHPDVTCRLVVGRRVPATEALKDARPFVGLLDELAFYDHPLSPEEVERHFRLAHPAVRP